MQKEETHEELGFKISLKETTWKEEDFRVLYCLIALFQYAGYNIKFDVKKMIHQQKAFGTKLL